MSASAQGPGLKPWQLFQVVRGTQQQGVEGSSTAKTSTLLLPDLGLRAKKSIQATGSAGHELARQALAPKSIALHNEPNPNRDEHAYFTMRVVGFRIEESGDFWGKGEVYFKAAGIPISSVVKAGDGESIVLGSEQSQTLVLPSPNLDQADLVFDFSLWDEDSSSDDRLAEISGSVSRDKLRDSVTKLLTITAESVEDEAEVQVQINRHTIQASDVTPAFIAMRKRDWTRIARDYALNQRRLAQAEHKTNNEMPMPGVHVVGSYIEGQQLAEDLRRGVLAVRSSILDVDSNLKEWPELRDSYNAQIWLLANTEIIERRPPLPPAPIPIPPFPDPRIPRHAETKEIAGENAEETDLESNASPMVVQSWFPFQPVSLFLIP